jgi:hypothetical protein
MSTRTAPATKRRSTAPANVRPPRSSASAKKPEPKTKRATQKAVGAAKQKKEKPPLPPGYKRRPGAGRKKGDAGNFVPTDAQRTIVKAAASARMPQDEIALLVINPATGKPISETTLKQTFHDEIQQGYADLRVRIHQAKVKAALEGNPTMIIWSEKTLFGVRENVDVTAPPEVDGEPADHYERARRIAFTLALGASVAVKKTVLDK